jgi:hypothetical protein
MMMNFRNVSVALLVPGLLMISPLATAAIPGIGRVDTDATSCSGTACSFSLTATAGHIALGDGNSLLTWGYADSRTGVMQYPGPTLIVNQGDTVEITLGNTLADPVSIVFPGQTGVSAMGGTAGLMTNEVATGDTVTYSFTASDAGTYIYQSGSNPELQIEMGLVGALIVRPTGFVGSDTDTDVTRNEDRSAYGTPGTAYDREFLFFLTDMDRSAHDRVDQGLPADPASFSATLWFMNGRNGPDTLHPHGAEWLPNQPYGSLAQMKPGERTLMRIIGAGRDLHPLHHHGNNAWLIARDGRVLQSDDGSEAVYPDFEARPPYAGIPELESIGALLPDQSISNFTVQVVPGATYDAIFTWTGAGLNWDIYGNRDGHNSATCDAADPEATRLPFEDPNSHCKDLTVVLPEQQALTFGGLWTGSPYLGLTAGLPPGEGGLNPNGGFSYMWHSHTERELVNDDVFPGGMMTMMIVEERAACIAELPGDCP